jgi:hypothetical protein
MPKIKTFTVKLYSLFASAFVNDDLTGLTEEDLKEFDYICDKLYSEHGGTICVDVLDDEEFGYPDIALENLKGNVCTFVFME